MAVPTENDLASRLGALQTTDLQENIDTLKGMGLAGTNESESNPPNESENSKAEPSTQESSEKSTLDASEKATQAASEKSTLEASEKSTQAASEKVEQSNEGEISEAAKLLHSLSYQVEIKLADQQADPNSPLYSVKKFEDLHLSPELLKGLYMMGFQRPSKIQERALPLLLSNPPRHMIGQSQSGTGKTAAFVLTMLTRIDPNLHAPQAICIAPTRELAKQILDVAESMSMFLTISKCLAIPGSLPSGESITAQMIIGTPGTLKAALSSRQLNAKDIKVLVTDEADQLIGTASLGDQTIQVKNNIQKVNKQFQIVLFSATWVGPVRDYASRFAPGANEITLELEKLTVDGIKQFYIECGNEQEKYNALVELYEILSIAQSIIFVQRRDTADEIAKRMNSEGHVVVVLHGAQDGPSRDATIKEFRKGKHKVLIATNVVSRGLDISQVNMVINYDLPLKENNQPDSPTYLHRIGRTGRFGRKGVSISFVSNAQSLKTLMTIKSALGIADDQLIRIKPEDFNFMEKTLKAALKGN